MRYLFLAILLASSAIAGSKETKTASEIQRIKALWPGSEFVAHYTKLNAETMSKIKGRCGRSPQAAGIAWYQASNGDRAFFDSVLGKHLPIDYALLLDAQGKIKALEILAYREAYGGQVKQHRWRNQFLGRDLNSHLKLGAGIDGIAGATISCRHVTQGVQFLLAVSQELHEE